MNLSKLRILLALSISSTAALAIEVPFSYSFEASGFTDIHTVWPVPIPTVPSPISTISGSVSGFFVPGSFYTTVTLTSINLNIGGFEYDLSNTGGTVEEGLLLPGGGHSGSFTIAGLVSGTAGVMPGTDDFAVSIDDHLGNGFGQGGFAMYTMASTTTNFQTRNLSFWSLPIAVPDSCSSIGLLSCCVGGLMLTARKTKRATQRLDRQH